jgi:hypothetical protein
MNDESHSNIQLEDVEDKLKKARKARQICNVVYVLAAIVALTFGATPELWINLTERYTDFYYAPVIVAGTVLTALCLIMIKAMKARSAAIWRIDALTANAKKENNLLETSEIV